MVVIFNLLFLGSWATIDNQNKITKEMVSVTKAAKNNINDINFQKQ